MTFGLYRTVTCNLWAVGNGQWAMGDRLASAQGAATLCTVGGESGDGGASVVRELGF